MGIIYSTSMSPGKDELVSAWLVRQDFYLGKGQPKLHHIGGFRLDDPAGHVGLELRLYADHADLTDIVYHVPLTYRDAPLQDAADYLLGTSEHGILGTRYVYDAVGDPVVAAQARALAAGQATAQHHSESFEDEPRVRLIGTPAGQQLEVVRRPVTGVSDGHGVIGFWEDALGQELTGLVLRTA